MYRVRVNKQAKGEADASASGAQGEEAVEPAK